MHFYCFFVTSGLFKFAFADLVKMTRIKSCFSVFGAFVGKSSAKTISDVILPYRRPFFRRLIGESGSKFDGKEAVALTAPFYSFLTLLHHSLTPVLTPICTLAEF